MTDVLNAFLNAALIDKLSFFESLNKSFTSFYREVALHHLSATAASDPFLPGLGCDKSLGWMPIQVPICDTDWGLIPTVRSGKAIYHRYKGAGCGGISI